LSMTRSHKKHLRIIENASREWGKIDKKSLETAISLLYKSKLIKEIYNKDGTSTMILSINGKKKALTYNIDNISVSKHPWDKKWRIVIFDIPEKLKKVRESLRYQLKRLGFKELQHSVFVLPFKCEDEINYIVEFYNVRRFVRYIEASHIDNELDLKSKFSLI